MVESAKPSQQGKRLLVDAFTNPGDHTPLGFAVREPGSTRPYDSRKSVLSENHEELFQQSVPIKNEKGTTVRWAVEEVDGRLVYHRFEQHIATSITGMALPMASSRTARLVDYKNARRIAQSKWRLDLFCRSIRCI